MADEERAEIYKPTGRKPKGGKIGAPVGHPGRTRSKLAQTDKSASGGKGCPHCGGRLKRCKK